MFVIALFERAFLPPQPDDRPGDLAGRCDCRSDRSGHARGPGSWSTRARWQRNFLITRARWQRNASPRYTSVGGAADDAVERAALHHSPLLLGVRPHVFLFALGRYYLVSPLEFRVFEGAILFFRERRLDARQRVGLSCVEFSEPFDLSGIDACQLAILSALSR